MGASNDVVNAGVKTRVHRFANPSGVVGEVAEGMPMVNTGYVTGVPLTAALLTKSLYSPNGESTSITAVLTAASSLLHHHRVIGTS